MKVTRTSIVSGKTRTLDLPVTEEQIDNYLIKGMLIQEAFPNLTPDQREFIMTGITDEEWNETFKDDED